MFKQLNKSFYKYLENLDKVGFFGIFIILTLVLMPVISSFVSTGTSFIRFTSIYADLTIPQILVLLGVGAVSVLFISIFLSGLISTIKLQETLDHVTYRRVMAEFKKYTVKIFTYLSILTLLSVAIGTALTYIGVPSIFIHLFILVPWLLFLFTPQVAAIENFDTVGSMEDAFKFVKDHPMPLVKYFILGAILMLLLVVLETLLGQFFTWEHRIVSIILVSLFVLPLLQIYATELYLERYPLTNI